MKLYQKGHLKRIREKKKDFKHTTLHISQDKITLSELCKKKKKIQTFKYWFYTS